jgi:hypothetical protein
MMLDAWMAPVWLIVNGLLGWGCWRTVQRGFSDDDALQKLGHTTLLFYASIIGGGTLLGLFHLLYSWCYLLLVAGIGGYLTWRDWTQAKPPEQVESPTVTVSRYSVWSQRFWLLIWGWVIAFWVSHTVLCGVLKFPTDWDTLMYHLPLVNHWLQDHSLYSPYALRWSEPGNNELFALWLVAPFSGDFLYSFNNLPASILLACGTSELARSLSVAPAVRHLTALVVVGNFVVLNQLQDAENDVASAGLFVTALSYIFRLARQWRWLDLALGVTALGLLAGTKFYALGYASVVILIALVVLPFAQGWRKTGQAAGAGLVGLILMGGYWYARNFWISGAPLFPLGAKADGENLTETYPTAWQSTFAGNESPELWDLTLTAIVDLLGPAYTLAFLGLPLSLFWLLASGAFSRKTALGVVGDLRVCFALAILLAFSVLVITPFAVEDVPGTLNQMRWKYCPVRYGLSFISLAIVAGMLVLSDLTRGLSLLMGRLFRLLGGSRIERISQNICQILFTLLLTAGTVWQWYHQYRPERFDLENSALLAVNIVFVVVNLVLVVGCLKRFLGFFLFSACTVILSASTVCLLEASSVWHSGFAEHYDKMMAGDLNRYLETRYTTSTVIAVLDHRCYPLFGSRRQYRVLQLSPARSTEFWDEVVRQQKVNLVIARFDVSKDSRSWYRVQPWIYERTDRFRPLTDLTTPYILFRVESE